jgi:hypothetical protein
MEEEKKNVNPNESALLQQAKARNAHAMYYR